jgi:hypothetical protein
MSASESSSTVLLPKSSSFYIVMPAKAGIQHISLDPRFRGGDERFKTGV